MPAAKLKRALRPVIRDLVREIARKVFFGLRVRCRACGAFFLPGQVGVAGCKFCDYHSAACNGCGGRERSERGVRVHAHWFAKRDASHGVP